MGILSLMSDFDNQLSSLMRFNELQKMRAGSKDPELQKKLAPLEHGAYAEGAVLDDPLNAATLAIATPAYYLAKQPGLIKLSQMLGMVGDDATPADLDQVKEAYRGIGRGLQNSDFRNTGSTLKSLILGN